MKALIVEDELLARVGLRSLIDWQAMGITLLEDAQDGREALVLSGKLIAASVCKLKLTF